MEIFRTAFNRERNSSYKRGGRQISDLNILDGGIPEYVIYYSSAQEHQKNGQLEKALELINKSIELADIDDWKQFAFKANVLESLGQHSLAIPNYEKAIDINSSDTNVYALYHQIGFCHFSLGNDEKAIEFYTYSLNLKEQHPNTEFNSDQEGMLLGVLYGVTFKKILNNRANALFRIDKLNEAVEDCKKSLQYDSNYSFPYLLLFHIFKKANQEQRAIDFLRKSAELGNRNAITILESIDEVGGQDNRAELEKCLKLTFEEHNILGAKQLSKRLIDNGVNDLIPYLCLSAIYATEENWRACEEVTEIGLGFDSNNTMLLNHMGVAICEQNYSRIPEGLSYFKRGFDLGDQNCGQNYQYWNNRM